jgi:hypothetical protein
MTPEAAVLRQGTDFCFARKAEALSLSRESRSVSSGTFPFDEAAKSRLEPSGTAT